MTKLHHLASLLALLGTAVGDALPYNPTRILLSSNASHAYVFQPATQENDWPQLSTIDISSTIPSDYQSSVANSQSLPFDGSKDVVSYTPILDSTGNITVIAGNCSDGANGTNVWRLARGAGKNTQPTWQEYKTSAQELAGIDGLVGSNFLAGGIAFSEEVDADGTDTNFFVFGGMCPHENTTADTWTSAADYSNLMLVLSANGTEAGYTDYNIDVTSSRGPPIAEAGFSITPLAPTYSVNTSGQAQKQQQDFVLLGGQTQSAFINMSQVALFSLPQESWTFLPVTQPSGAKTDLAARQSETQEVEPRSGHTAVLTEDGNSVILFGGWVGDISTPAQPQLALLEFGSGYGGDGAWSWSIPSASGSGLAAGAGIYGHGAAMLPGDVMMVIGGYNIAASVSGRRKRDSQAANTQAYFYNVSSSTWLDQYNPPASVASAADSDDGPLSRKSQQAGLGAGLGIGAAILVSLVVFYFWYTRRLKRARDSRGRALLSRSSDGSFPGQLEQPLAEKGDIDGRGGDAAAVGRFWNVWDHDTGAYPDRAQQMQQSGAAGSTGLFVNIPSPTRGLRKGLAGRNYQYHAAPRNDDKRISRGSGNIHPIAEHEEEDEHAGAAHDDLTDAERKLREVERVLNSPDPFLEAEPNPLGSHPVSPELSNGDTVKHVPTGASRVTQQRRPSDANRTDVPNWTTEPGPSEPLLRIDTGRVSPSKTDERTSSTLSEKSHISTGSVTRTMSTRTSAILAAAAAARVASNSSPENSNSSSSDGRTHTMSTSGGRKSPFYYQTRARSSTAGSVQTGAPNSASTDADSFTTARTGFAELQSQGEALLGGRPAADRGDPYQRALAAHTSTRQSKAPVLFDEYGVAPPIPPRRRQGWMGSLRRALNVVSMGERSFSMTGTLERYSDEQPTSSSSPTKERDSRIGSAPRRAASDGGALLRQKRGKSDWEDNHWPRYRDDPDPEDWGEPARSSVEKQAAEEEWDVEGAASKRDVQVMFTVPKARLRVVNADMDRVSLRSASDGALSRTDSVKNLRREESVRTLRARSEGDKVLLPSTAEEEKTDGTESGLKEEDGFGWVEKEKAA